MTSITRRGSVPRTSNVVRTLFIALLFAAVWALATSPASAAPTTRTLSAGFGPVGLFAADGPTLGAPTSLTLPNSGSHWTSPSAASTSGLVVAWAKLQPEYAATAIGEVSPDGRNWIEVVRGCANANRSVPYVNLTLPVPAGYRYRLTLEGARGEGLEIVEESGATWFPLGGASD